ncbi:MAG: hypothetical protein M1405_03560 [Patescibacteria group bacterium]|nr:hypothetical protein [Patescibacteria group bacterium]
MSGESTSEQITSEQRDREAQIGRHYDIATNPKINIRVRNASAEALSILKKAVGNENYVGIIGRRLFKKT